VAVVHYSRYNKESFKFLNRCRVIIIHYGFEKFKKMRRIGNSDDIVALENTFATNRNYQVRSWKSPSRQELLDTKSWENQTADNFPILESISIKTSFNKI